MLFFSIGYGAENIGLKNPWQARRKGNDRENENGERERFRAKLPYRRSETVKKTEVQQ